MTFANAALGVMPRFFTGLKRSVKNFYGFNILAFSYNYVMAPRNETYVLVRQWRMLVYPYAICRTAHLIGADVYRSAGCVCGFDRV